jgi:hypothetical protein
MKPQFVAPKQKRPKKEAEYKPSDVKAEEVIAVRGWGRDQPI